MSAAGPEQPGPGGGRRFYLGLVSPDAPASCTGALRVLTPGSERHPGSCTVSYARDADVRCVIDPGPLAHPSSLLLALNSAGEVAEAITDVVFTHYHAGHSYDATDFPNARVHDQQAELRNAGTARALNGLALAPSIRLIATPGRSVGDITVLVGTPLGVFALTHLWWSADGAVEDPMVGDPGVLQHSRRRVLAIATHIVPGHGRKFRAGPDTPI